MSLPASQYSVLDANRIERITDDTFRCYVGGLKFINFTVEPVLTVSVVTHARGCTISLLDCKVSLVQYAEQCPGSSRTLLALLLARCGMREQLFA